MRKRSPCVNGVSLGASITRCCPSDARDVPSGKLAAIKGLAAIFGVFERSARQRVAGEGQSLPGRVVQTGGTKEILTSRDLALSGTTSPSSA